MDLTSKEKLRSLFHQTISDRIHLSKFHLLDVSVSQKLQFAADYHRELAELTINQFPLKLDESQSENGVSTTSVNQSANSPNSTYSDTQLIGSTQIYYQLPDLNAYCYNLNKLLDGFFTSLRSSLDTLAHHMITIYSSCKQPEKLYIRNISAIISLNYEKSKVPNILDKRLKEDWFNELCLYRDCTTHENLIPYTMNIPYAMPSLEFQEPVIMLPDDPKLWPFTCEKQREPTQYCGYLLLEVQSLVEDVYAAILEDAEQNDNIVPIQ
jgi:hypothetical protein